MPDDLVMIDVRVRFRIPRSWLGLGEKLRGHLIEMLRDHGHRKVSLTPFYNATSTDADSLDIEVLQVVDVETGQSVNLRS